MSEKTIIEVNGVKLEVDMRYARRIEEIRVGDRVKILVKEGYSDGFKVYNGVVIGFEPFQKAPTIIIAYISSDWATTEIKFVHFNAKTEDIEIVKSVDDDGLSIDRGDILKQFERMILQKQKEIEELELKRDYFLKNFRAYWEPVGKTESVS